MKLSKTVVLALLVIFSANIVCAQMIRNKAIHFKRHRVVHHHHKK
ncbi:hypothetical protein [Mucilaginibacter inviolabilis]|nr:hypothetical protein [Mucilaginibacter inviolabilis]